MEQTMKSDDVHVTVESRFLPEQSHPDQHEYVFAYTVKITNQSHQAVQVVSRQWIITDASQRVQEVGGLGVVGRQPVIAPGETFEYTSGCPLRTAVGTMRGTYHCVGEDGAPLQVPIKEFILAAPRSLH